MNDYPGFVSNRVLMPMINEAVYCVMEGVGSAEAIDTVMKLGMNHPMGPLALADLIGLDTCVAILEVLQDGLGDPKYRPCPLLEKYVAAGWLGRKSGGGSTNIPDAFTRGARPARESYVLGADSAHRRATRDPEHCARVRAGGDRAALRQRGTATRTSIGR